MCLMEHLLSLVTGESTAQKNKNSYIFMSDAANTSIPPATPKPSAYRNANR